MFSFHPHCLLNSPWWPESPASLSLHPLHPANFLGCHFGSCFYYVHFAFIFSFGAGNYGTFLHLGRAAAPYGHCSFYFPDSTNICHNPFSVIVRSLHKRDIWRRISYLLYCALETAKIAPRRKLHGEDYDVVGCYQKWDYFGGVCSENGVLCPIITRSLGRMLFLSTKDGQVHNINVGNRSVFLALCHSLSEFKHRLQSPSKISPFSFIGVHKCTPNIFLCAECLFSCLCFTSR